MPKVFQAGRWLRFLGHVPNRAIAGRVLHGLKRKMVGRAPAFIRPRTIAADPFIDAKLQNFAQVWRATSERFRDIEGLEHGVVTIRGASVNFGSVEAMDWSPRFPDKPHLSNWAYDFGFFHFAVVLVERDVEAGVTLLARMLTVMERRHAIGRGQVHFVWNPIVVAVRILCLSAAGAFARSSGVGAENPDLIIIARHIAYSTAFLSHFAERYLGYNHALFALVALAAGEVAVHDAGRAERLSREAVFAINAQVLSDGMQAERTATYHIHVLLLARALQALGHTPSGQTAWLTDLIERMLAATDVLTHPDGEIALFSDCAMEDSVPPALVGWVPNEEACYRTVLPEAGYTKLVVPLATVIFDHGKLGPDDVIGHAHADFLSFELSVVGRRCITDPGVFSYSAGSQRDITRSASSHNGPTYVGKEPAEFFGAWRVGWRGRAHQIEDTLLPAIRPYEIAGWCDGFDRFGGRTLRYLGLAHDGSLLVVDVWRATETLEPALRLLFPDNWTITKTDERAFELINKDGTRASLTSSSFGASGPTLSEWRPKGAMVPAMASELCFRPASRANAGHYVNALHIAPGKIVEFPGQAEAVAKSIMPFLYTNAAQA